MERKSASTIQSVSIFGLGKLGAVIAGCYANRGYRTIGVDVNRAYVDSCNRGVAPVQEPGIETLYRSCRGLLTATTDGTPAVLQSDASLITVPTPSEPDGGYSLRHVLETCKIIGKALSNKDGYHLVVLKSTVLPGSCDQEIVPALESHSGKRCGTDLGFCYNPEFIALGSVIHDLLNPDLILIGESDATAGDLLSEIYLHLLDNERPMARMNLVNAELTKLALNSYLTMKITFANLLGRMCELLPDGDVDAVTGALGLDSRVGAKYLKGGLGYGGPCFPRDNRALLSFARRLSISFPLAEATDQANHEIAERVADLAASQLPRGGRIGILGLSYKPNTPVTDESQGILIAKILKDRGFTIAAYDPLAMESARCILGNDIYYAKSTQDCILNASLVLITTPWDEFRKFEFSPRNGSDGPLIIDCWGILEESSMRSAPVIRLGRNSPRIPSHRPGSKGSTSLSVYGKR